jgi:hypothetical protein
MFLCRNLPGGTEKTHENLDSIADAPTEIRIDEPTVSCRLVESLTDLPACLAGGILNSAKASKDVSPHFIPVIFNWSYNSLLTERLSVAAS